MCFGNFNSAERYLRRALVVEDEMNGPPWKVRTLIALADVASARAGDGDGDGDLALQLRAEAVDLAASIGLPTLIS